MIHTGAFVLLHEVGHALAHVLSLPVTGREEDAVDDLAGVLLIERGDTDQALSAALNFAIAAQRLDLSELPWWDEHSMSPQRMYNLLCMAYGSDPEAHAYLVENGSLPPDRAQRCPAEYGKKSHAWFRLLEPYQR